MQNQICLKISACLSEEGFSLDELILAIRELFASEGDGGMATLAVFILKLYEEMLIGKYLVGKHPCDCGACRKWEMKDRRPRSFRTGLGKISLDWRRMRCRGCGAISIPLGEKLTIDSWQTRTSELQKTVEEVVGEQSYRRSSKEIQSLRSVDIPHSTMHRWVVESQDDDGLSSKEPLVSVYADGTCYKGKDDQGKAKEGDLKVVFGIADSGHSLPLGVWAGESWENIGNELNESLAGSEAPPKLMLCDGELAIAKHLGPSAEDLQRCHWHLVRDLNHTAWQDEAPLAARKKLQSKLSALLAIELPKEDFEKVPEKEVEEIRRQMTEAEGKLVAFANGLDRRGFGKAADYVRRAFKGAFGYVRTWLKYGIVCHRASSLIERLMRELARRVKRIAYNWKERGVQRVSSIIVRRFQDPKRWEEFWAKKINRNGNVILHLLSVRA
jgi:hypothetical protein